MTGGFQELDWYESPLYYDIVFEEDTRLEATFLQAMLELWGDPKTDRVLEPACGSGRLVLELARRDYRVHGFDLSEEMLAFTRERLDREGLDAELSVKRMEDFRVRGRFGLAHCLVSTFKYLRTEAHARSHLQCVARALGPRGIYVLGLHLTDYASMAKTRERWVGERRGTHVVCNIQGWPADRQRRTERVRSRLVVTERGVERRMETNWDFRTYDAAELRGLLASVPELEHLATYDFTYGLDAERDLDDEQLDCVLILRKRG